MVGTGCEEHAADVDMGVGCGDEQRRGASDLCCLLGKQDSSDGWVCD